MPVANWGLAGTPQFGFENALAQGMQMGAQLRQARERREDRNVFAGFVKDPSEQTFGALADRRPEIAMQVQGDMRARQAEAATADLTRRALAGDESALTELATVNFERYSKLDKSIQDKAQEEAKVMGEVALMMKSISPGQWLAKAEELKIAMPQYADTFQAFIDAGPSNQGPLLDAAIAEARLFKQLRDMTEPEQFNIGPGEGRYERDPQTGDIRTVVQPNYGNAPAFTPVQPSPRSAPSGERGIFTEMRRASNGNTYYKIDGKWYDNPEGR